MKIVQTMDPILQTQNISKVYGEDGDRTDALRNVTLAINKGESVAILGKSGSGKSTLMHILATLDQPSSGSVFVHGRPLSAFTTTGIDSLRNKKFGFVFQQFFLNGKDTCLENVMLPLVIMGVSKAERTKRGLQVLADVGMPEKAAVAAHNLSGGQKQRLCIARALISNPEVIFADEPTGNLDSENGKIVANLLFDLNKSKNITLVIVTHDSDLASLCNRVITIKDGQIINEEQR